jgi:hypothetical protein
MSAPARTVAMFSVYLFITGLSFLFIPNVVLPLFGFQATTEVWIRVLGLLVMIVGSYYLYCARCEFRPFLRATVLGRVAFCMGLVTLALFDAGGPMLVLFGSVDLAGALWTGLSLRAESSNAIRVGNSVAR